MKKSKNSYNKNDFRLFQNKAGHLMLLIRTTSKEIIQNAKFIIYDGKKSADLYRSHKSMIPLSLEEVPFTLYKHLIKSKELLVCEVNQDMIIQEYKATVKIQHLI